MARSLLEAAQTGNINELNYLLTTSPDPFVERTAEGQTALHLAVKSNQIEAFCVLVEHLKQRRKEYVINWQDNEGNTVLHVAAAVQNLEVVDFMLRGNALQRKFVEVNASNKSGLTPLDVSSYCNREIRGILLRAGAIHGQESLHGREPLGNIRSDLLVVAVLIASATYQAVLQPPTLLKKIETRNMKGFVAAYLSFETSTIGTNFALFGFLCGNTFGFFLSVQMIISLTKNLRLKLPLMLSTIAMVGTYISCMANVPSRSLRDENFSPLGAVLIQVLATLIPAALLLVLHVVAPEKMTPQVP